MVALMFMSTVAGFVGDSPPVIGVCILSSALGSVAAGAIVGFTIGAFAVVALIVGSRFGRPR